MLMHYVVVRRDLPFGDICAQIAHAAGESFYALAAPVRFSTTTMASGACAGNVFSFPSSSVLEHQTFSLEVGGSIPPSGSTFDPAQTVAVVLGARNEGKLKRLQAQLLAADVPFVAITETDGPFAGQLTAIGLVPGEKATLARHVREFHMLTGLEPK